MLTKLSVAVGSSFDPYFNLAAEEFMTFHVPEDECILYLWQNQRTVVIGRNQNCWKECLVDELEADGGKLARRSSGGGAVFHDLGNLNFSFCMRTANSDIAKQMRVIIEAASSFGLDAEATGRNDAAVCGRKFSGNAFLDSRGSSCHHGTLLINADMSMMSKYLRPSSSKLSSKGVSSVRSRVVNLSELCADITVDSMKEALAEAFAAVYGIRPETFDMSGLDQDEIRRISLRLSSDEWLYGRHIPFTDRIGARFEWGEAELCLEADRGVISDAVLYTDAMDPERFADIGKELAGCRYSAGAISSELRDILSARGLPESVAEELAEMVRTHGRAPSVPLS